MPTASPAVVPEVAPPALEPMGARVRLQRRRLGLTLDELAARAGMSKPYLSLIETGRVGNPPSDEKLRRLEGVLQFPAGELVSQAHLQRTPAAVRAVLADLLRAAGHLPAPADGDAGPLAAALRSLIARAGNDLAALASIAPPAPRSVVDPTGGPAISPGSVSGFVGCPGLTDPAAYAAGVTGDAMAPRYRDGDLVVFSPAAPVRPGDDCFVRLADGRSTFRRVFREGTDDSDGGGNGGADVVRLQPRNERYRPLVVPLAQVAGAHRAVYRYEELATDTA